MKKVSSINKEKMLQMVFVSILALSLTTHIIMDSFAQTFGEGKKSQHDPSIVDNAPQTNTSSIEKQKALAVYNNTGNNSSLGNVKRNLTG